MSRRGWRPGGGTQREPTIASCSCGQLSIICTGEPVRISVCHCLDCQKLTESAFGPQARFRRSDVCSISSMSKTYERVADSGNRLTFHFCPRCGSTVHYELDYKPDVIAIPVGAFADLHFSIPARFSLRVSQASLGVFATRGRCRAQRLARPRVLAYLQRREQVDARMRLRSG